VSSQDASDEDIRFVRSYVQDHRKPPGQLKCVPRSLEVANFPVDWTVHDIVELFAEYGVTNAQFNTTTKTVRVDVSWLAAKEQMRSRVQLICACVDVGRLHRRTDTTERCER
jgi:hypothetical protein